MPPLLPPETVAGIASTAAESLSFDRFVVTWNGLQSLSTPSLHSRIAKWLEKSWDGGDRRLLLLIFRNAGKSTLVGLFVAWLLCRNPDLRVLVVSADHMLATKMTRFIRSVLERHERAAHLLPKAPEQWACDRFTLPRQRAMRDPSVLGRGISGNVTGSRADVVIYDDVEVPNTADSPEKRADLRDRLRELGFVLDPAGLQLFVGTPHSYHSIYAETAREDIDKECAFLSGFKRLVVPVVDAQGESAWPERFPPATLDRIKAETGPNHYRSQMMLIPTHDRDIRLDPAGLARYDLEIAVSYAAGRMRLELGDRRMLGACCWWDPAYGKPGSGDSSVIACVFADEEGRYWLHDIAYLTFDPDRLSETDEATQLCRKAIAFAVRNEQRCLAIENNGLGKFLPGLVRREASRLGAALSVQEHRSVRAKASRILEAFDPVLAAGHLHAHERVWKTPFIDEMREWSPGGSARDDGLDAVAACLSTQPVRLGAVGPTPRPPDWGGHGSSYVAQTDFAV